MRACNTPSSPAHRATSRTAANWTETLSHAIPERASNWWLLGPARRGLEYEAEKLRTKNGKSDGPVTVQSAKLTGVNDVVLLHADHCTLFYPVDRRPQPPSRPSPIA